MVDDLLDYDSIIRGLSVRKKTRLRGTDEVSEKTINNDFDNNFILNVTKSNGPGVPQIGSIGTFRNKAKVVGIDLGIHDGRGKGFSAKFDCGGAQNVPIFLVHYRVNSIRAKCFVGFDLY